jgi:hypothetical protein
MNNNNNRGGSKKSQGTASSKHHFTYDSSEDDKKRPHNEQRGFKKIHTGKSIGSSEYMKPTVNADLKKDNPQPTIAKTKHIMNEAKKKFNEEHTFKPAINDYQMPSGKEQSKEERWKKLTEPKTTEVQKRERIRA